MEENNDFGFSGNGDSWGFSLVSETELKEHENLLRKKIEEQNISVKKTETHLTDKLHGLRDMIMPLLNNMAKDPQKEYIWWPDRSEKMKAFIEKINRYVEE